ncbi:MAG: hypothetical protein BWX66_01443 [Deltaproteobacteria bacterium ADurb.Bin058]|nr:MAG: hypothetical protein BWX66_01443 [Deltaproteobacteria bacterium ADurb.Bin058]
MQGLKGFVTTKTPTEDAKVLKHVILSMDGLGVTPWCRLRKPATTLMTTVTVMLMNCGPLKAPCAVKDSGHAVPKDNWCVTPPGPTWSVTPLPALEILKFATVLIMTVMVWSTNCGHLRAVPVLLVRDFVTQLEFGSVLMTSLTLCVTPQS